MMGWASGSLSGLIKDTEVPYESRRRKSDDLRISSDNTARQEPLFIIKGVYFFYIIIF